MTLVAARRRAVTAITAAVARPVKVFAFDGVMDAQELSRQSISRPSVHVSVMGRDDDRNVRITAYAVATTRVPADDAALTTLDAVEEALRTLLGAGRPLLSVRTQTLYDPRAVKAGSAALWAVSVTLPPLVGDAPDAADEGLLRALDALLAQHLRWRWAGTEPQRDRLLLDGALPFALVVYAADAPVTGGPSSAYRYVRDGSTYERTALGQREVTATVELLGRTEDEVEAELDHFLERVPRRWEYEGLTLPVHVRRVVGSHWRRKEGAHAAVAEVVLEAAVPQGAERLVQTRRIRPRPGCDDPAAPPEGTLTQAVEPVHEED